MRVLLVEDEPHLGSAVQEHVQGAGHAVDWVRQLGAADDAVRSVPYDALLLDLHLPDGRGLDFLKTLRRRGNPLPVVILTARDQVSDRIEGLRAGADDYLVKPFDLDELNARLQAVARRYHGKSIPTIHLGDPFMQLRPRGFAIVDTEMVWAVYLIFKCRVVDWINDCVVCKNWLSN